MLTTYVFTFVYNLKFASWYLCSLMFYVQIWSSLSFNILCSKCHSVTLLLSLLIRHLLQLPFLFCFDGIIHFRIFFEDFPWQKNIIRFLHHSICDTICGFPHTNLIYCWKFLIDVISFYVFTLPWYRILYFEPKSSHPLWLYLCSDYIYLSTLSISLFIFC